MTSIVNYNEPITQPNFSNILYPLVFVGFVTFVLWKINYECKKTIKHMDNKLSALDTKWVSRMETMVGNTFDSMGNKLAKLEAENAQLKMIVYETVAKQNEEITLTKYQSEKYIDTMFVSLDSELTNKLEDLTTHVILIDKENKTLEDKLVLFGCQVNQQIEKCEKEIAYAKNNYTNMLDNMELFCERMYTTENQVSNNSHTLSELTDQIQEQMSLIKSCNKDALYNIELLNDKLSALTIGYDETFKELVHTMDTLHNSHISLKTEFEERNKYVAIGYGQRSSGNDYCDVFYVPAKEINTINTSHDLYKNTPGSSGYYRIKYDLSCLSKCRNIKTFDIWYLFALASSKCPNTELTDVNYRTLCLIGIPNREIVYVNGGASSYYKRDEEIDKCIVENIQSRGLYGEILKSHKGIQNVIEYIRSIRPDIELTWNGTPI